MTAVLWFLRMRGGWIVAALGAVGACTAPNPEFGDADDGTGSTSRADGTTDKPTTDPTFDPTRPSSTSDDDTSTPTESSGMGPATDATQTTTSDDAGTDDDTSTPTTSAEEGSSEASTGGAIGDVVLFVAAIENGQLAGDGVAASQAGAEICADAVESLGFDFCGGTYHALIRTAPMPFATPELVASLDSPVVSIEGEAIAENLQSFLDGAWEVLSLTSIAAGGFADLENSALATGGSSDGDRNCEDWTTADGAMTIGHVDGGGGWFSAAEIGCASPASILCLCLP